MTQHTENSLRINLPANQIWQVLDNYGDIKKFALTIQSSEIVGELTTGLGAKRKCTFNDGSSLVEEITEYKQGEGYKMKLSEHSMPVKRMVSEMKVTPIDSNSCQLYMSTDFEMKGGIIGKLIGTLLMKPMMKGIFRKIMTGLAYHTKTGEVVDKKLPTKEQYAGLVGN